MKCSLMISQSPCQVLRMIHILKGLQVVPHNASHLSNRRVETCIPAPPAGCGRPTESFVDRTVLCATIRPVTATGATRWDVPGCSAPLKRPCRRSGARSAPRCMQCRCEAACSCIIAEICMRAAQTPPRKTRNNLQSLVSTINVTHKRAINHLLFWRLHDCVAQLFPSLSLWAKGCCHVSSRSSLPQV